MKARNKKKSKEKEMEIEQEKEKDMRNLRNNKKEEVEEQHLKRENKLKRKGWKPSRFTKIIFLEKSHLVKRKLQGVLRQTVWKTKHGEEDVEKNLEVST